MSIGMTAVEYRWAEGSKIGVDAAAAGKELDRIAKERGTVAPESVVDAARPETSPIHPHFEWDDSEAAERYRQVQARQMIRSLVVVYVRNDTEEPQPPVRALVKLKPLVRSTQTPILLPNEYTPVKQVMSSDELHLHMVRQAMRSLTAWSDQYGDMAEFAQVRRLVDRLKALYD